MLTNEVFMALTGRTMRSILEEAVRSFAGTE